VRWEGKVDVRRVFELRCRTIDFFGVGAIEKFDLIADRLKEMGVDAVLLVTGRSSYRTCGAWDVVRPALESRGIRYALYDRVLPNPTVRMIDEAKEMGLSVGAKAVIGIGGGSPIDTAKGVAILLEHPERSGEELYTFRFAPSRARPVIAINTTHGTGTEVDRFAVASIPEKEYKPAIAYECIYPLYAIDDPALTTGLPADQTAYVTIDALNHITEAATTKATSPLAVDAAVRAADLIFRYLPEAIANPTNLTARYFLLYASAIAGISFDNGLLHFTHALEHPLSALKPELPHGLGLAMLLPAVVKHVYPHAPEVLAAIYKPITPEARGLPGEGEAVARRIERWLFQMGARQKLSDFGFKEDDVKELADLARNTPGLDGLIKLAPVPKPMELVEEIYRDSIYPLI